MRTFDTETVMGIGKAIADEEAVDEGCCELIESL